MPSNSTRSRIKDALVAKLATVTFPTAVNGVTTWAYGPTRRLRMFNKIDPANQPAAFIVQHREGYDAHLAGVPPRRWLEVGIWCFAPTGADDVVGDEYLDDMMQGIEAVLGVPDDIMRNELTLGGLCYYCRIDWRDGLFIRDPGDIDGQALLVVPIRIVLP